MPTSTSCCAGNWHVVVGARRGGVSTECPAGGGDRASLAPTRTIARVGTVDERSPGSYNVEMLERVTGGKFWKPYGPELDAILKQPAPTAASTGSGGARRRHESGTVWYLPPLDLTNPGSASLTAALGAHVRSQQRNVGEHELLPRFRYRAGGSSAGFVGVLTRQQWKGLVDFANAVDAGDRHVISRPVRERAMPRAPGRQRRRVGLLITLRQSAAALRPPYMNEPSLAAMGGAPAGYDAAAYSRDFRAFRALVKQAAPDMLTFGPGSVGESGGGDGGVWYGIPGVLDGRPAGRVWSWCGCLLLSPLRSELDPLCRNESKDADDGRCGTLRAMAVKDRRDACVLPRTPRQVRTRQAFLEYRNR